MKILFACPYTASQHIPPLPGRWRRNLFLFTDRKRQPRLRRGLFPFIGNHRPQFKYFTECRKSLFAVQDYQKPFNENDNVTTTIQISIT